MRSESLAAGLAVFLAASFFVVTAVQAGPTAAEKAVDMSNVQFSPKEVTINKADSVKWTNKDSFGHDVTFEDGVKSGAPGTLNASQSWSRTFDKTGTFRYRCAAHSSNFDSGMIGSVVVVDPASQPPQKTPGFEVAGLLAALALAGMLFAALKRRK